ncbi:cobalamin B12-binding domain-containing protein [Yoonia sediminilitoris]|uniref:B12 binding protein n=1 Tax=Yoonia sediminilitoris TaxID=1286148 RepID=A0A2T6KMI5_9RHOB|nr:cobalamin B12-binding domain-containing protein [Yoonia sediminilitoris]PUB17432.1 B12 binding protein [Yoonia sediminilitoris]RCW97727.1 B12 binding protein [Yoonia sediminilitoris]
MAVNRNVNAQQSIERSVQVQMPGDIDAAHTGCQALHLHAVPQSPTLFDEPILNMMQQAALGLDSVACSQAVKDALAAGIAAEDIADHYIPEISRRLGDDWCNDELGFGPVTIAGARLQFMLRELGPDWSGDKAADPDAPTILLIVPRNAHHTLGAMVLAGQMRRKGFSVRVLLDANSHEIAECVRRSIYDAVFISATPGETLESLRLIVRFIKSSSAQEIPVVIGGSLIDLETGQKLAVKTGADYATKSPEEALELCGLRAKTRNSAIRPVRGT